MSSFWSKQWLVLAFVFLIPGIASAQFVGRYVVTHADNITILIDSATGQSWALNYYSDKNGNTTRTSWKPLTFESLKNNSIYIYPVQNDSFPST